MSGGKLLVIFLLCVGIVSAAEVEFDTSSVVREGSVISAVVRVDEGYVERIDFLNSEGVVFSEEIGYSVADEVFSFSLELSDFGEMVEGEEIYVYADVYLGDGLVSRWSSVFVSSPLPVHAVDKGIPWIPSGWYVGDQHVHSEMAYDGEVPISTMANSAYGAGLDWVIFTDHSNYLSSSEWLEGYTSCTNQITSKFKCLYNQEMSVNSPGGNDASHYLAYPYFSDYLGYIDGTCTFWNSGCRDAQTIINEVNSAGGMGFLAHPYENSILSLDWEDWSVTGYTGLEIFNAKDGDWDYDDTQTRDKWIEFLLDETNPSNGFVVGIGNSDAHQTSELGHTFTYCYLGSLTTGNIRSALKNGRCVFSNGPFVEFSLSGAGIGDVVDVCVGPTSLPFRASSNAEFTDLDFINAFIGREGGEVYYHKSLSNLLESGDIDIYLQPNDKYVRLEVQSGIGVKGYTNPIWLNVVSTNNDLDSACSVDDCNDNDGTVYPGATEVCDGKDNDCDGDVDEGCSCSNGATQPCGPNTEEGSCEKGTMFCIGGSWSPCIGAVYPSTEVCSGVDDDCDGYIDEGGVCSSGGGGDCTPSPCNPPETGWDVCVEKIDSDYTAQAAYIFKDKQGFNDIRWGSIVDSEDAYVVGEYKMVLFLKDSDWIYYGTTSSTCSYGGCGGLEWGDYTTETHTLVTAPGIAYVDRLIGYNDASDGRWAHVCYEPHQPTYNNGQDPIYVIDCYDDGDCMTDEYCYKPSNWRDWECKSKCGNGVCDAGENCLADGSGIEACDGVDNNCNGQVDEVVDRSCGSDAGECVSGIQSCVGGDWNYCVGSIDPMMEICDGLDNDCDDVVDNGCDEDVDGYCEISKVIEAGASCVVGDCDYGCGIGVETCIFGVWNSCTAVEPKVEECNGLDDDCDGEVDEEIRRECGTDFGLCEKGFELCSEGEWGECTGVMPSDEICDSLDNDCDDEVDEGCACNHGEEQVCGFDLGECSFGNQICVAGIWQDCLDAIEPVDEICDGLDNDCDGNVDEELSIECGENFIGVCSLGIRECSSGEWGECIGEIIPSEEVCNDLDDNHSNHSIYKCFGLWLLLSSYCSGMVVSGRLF